jgi:hypothetical protein
MQRTYLALAGLGLTALGAHALTIPLAEARGVFTTQPLDPARIAVLGKPMGVSQWSLVVIEQLTAETPCWQARSDGLVEPVAGRSNPPGICASYLDSNGYSLRVADEDLGSTYRLRLLQVGQELQLQAMNPRELTPLVIGRAPLPGRDRDGFVPLRLEPDWQLSRRMYGEQLLSHVYFASASPLTQLIAQAGGPSEPMTVAASAPGSLDNFRLGSARNVEAGPIALQVIPFRE